MKPLKVWAILHHKDDGMVDVAEICYTAVTACAELSLHKRIYTGKHTLHAVTITEGHDDELS